MNKSDIKKLKWESSEFPILCNKCLGPNPYIRMMKAEYEGQCKICKRPFTLFTWKPDKNSRYKRTEICQTCSKLKNVCQTCLFDLQFGLPVEIRDKYLKNKIEIPKENANRDFFIANATKNFDKLDLPYYKEGAYNLPENFKNLMKKNNNNLLLENEKKEEITAKRNLPQICSFYVKGNCIRGNNCPYRHEIPDIDDNKLLNNSIENRFNGINDPIAKKILNQYSNMPKPPNDEKITTLCLNDLVDNSIKEKDIYKIFSKYGELKGVKFYNESNIVYITFSNREDAEKCFVSLYNTLEINKEKYRLSWAKIADPELINDNKYIKKEKEKENEKVNYKTECPLYDKDKNKNDIIKNKLIDDKIITYINLTSYDNGEKPYYASMDPKLTGGLLKKKRRAVDDL
jgi:pre-mRNA-splicing factor RBM22/SLT11